MEELGSDEQEVGARVVTRTPDVDERVRCGIAGPELPVYVLRVEAQMTEFARPPSLGTRVVTELS